MKTHLGLLFACLGVLTVVTAPAGALDLLYDFEGDSGAVIIDKLTEDGAQNGAISNNVTFETSQVPFGEQAGRFSAPVPEQLFSTIEIPGSTELGSAFTLAAYVNFTNTGFTRLFTSFRGTGPVGEDRIILDMDPSGSTIPGLRLIVNNIQAKTGAVPPGLTEPGYHHIAATYDDGAVAVYLDGVDVGVDPDTLASGPVTMTANLRFGEDPHDGGGSANEQFRGNVDELLVLGRALTAEEVVAIATSGVTANVTPAEGELAIYYDFEPPDSGTSIGDRFEGGNDGIAHNNVLIDGNSSNARFGLQSAVLGDKVPEELFSTIEIPRSSDLGSAFTLAANVNFTNTGFTRLFSSYGGTGPVGADRIILDMDPSGGLIPGLRLFINNMAALTTEPPAALSEPGYHHIAATYDDGAVAAYLDGAPVELDLGSLGSGPVVMAQNLRFGEDPHDLGGTASEQFRGNVDELLVLGRALTAEEVAELANSGVAATVTPAEGELAIYYDFEPPDSGTSIGDRSGGGNDGIVHNNVKIDENSANAAFGTQSAVLGDKPAPVLFSAIDVGEIGNLGNQFTMAAMVNVPGGGYASGGLARLFSTYAGGGSAAGRLIFDFNPNANVADIGIRFLLPDGTAVIHNGTFSVNENHHLAATYNRGDVIVYLDGQLVASVGTAGGDVDLGAFPLRIGEDLGGAVNENFIGVLDEVLILSRALSAEEVEALATLGFGSEPPATGTALAGDCNVDGELDISDLLCYTKSLFPQFPLLDRGPPPATPCDGDLASAGNVALLDLNGDERVDAVDAVALADYLFGAGGPPGQGTECLVVSGDLGCSVNPGCE